MGFVPYWLPLSQNPVIDAHSLIYNLLGKETFDKWMRCYPPKPFFLTNGHMKNIFKFELIDALLFWSCQTRPFLRCFYSLNSEFQWLFPVTLYLTFFVNKNCYYLGIILIEAVRLHDNLSFVDFLLMLGTKIKISLCIESSINNSMMQPHQ